MNRLRTLAPPIALSVTAALAGSPAYSADETDVEDDDEGTSYIEEIVVTGERGETNVLDRAMTVTGFSPQMIERLGIQNADDLEVLVPGLQKGNRSQGAGKNEDGHYDMRGVGNDRAINFFQDTSVAFYVDGVYTDQSYSTDSTFDMERVEVARGAAGHNRRQGGDCRRHQFVVAQADGHLGHAHERGDDEHLDPAVAGRLRRTDRGFRVQLPSRGQFLHR